MERIKQAIEKAKKQKSIGNEPKIQSHLVALGTPPLPPPISDTHDEFGNIGYEQTRVVKLQAEHLERNRIVSYNKNDPKSMAFDILRTHVLQKMEENGWRTLAVTSPTPGAGKTVIAINLAISIAHQTNKTALLVDFDLRRPRLGSYLGIPMEKSLNELLDGTAKLTDVLVNPGIPRLVVLPTKKPVKGSSETLSSKKVSDLIKDLRERYTSRIVIFDLPPLLVIDDAIALLPQIDCVLMVVANGLTTNREIEDSIRHLSSANLIGTVLNKAEFATKDYYYY